MAEQHHEQTSPENNNNNKSTHASVKAHPSPSLAPKPHLDPVRLPVRVKALVVICVVCVLDVHLVRPLVVHLKLR